MQAQAQDDVHKKAAKALRIRLHTVKKHLEPLFARPLSETYTKLSVTERYQLQVLLSYSLNTIYYIYLRTQGSDPNRHEVMRELLRVQMYIAKLKKAQGKEDKPRMKVDKEAADRFVKAVIKEDKATVEKEQAEKKRKLEEVVVSSDSEDEEEESPAPPPPAKKSKKGKNKKSSNKK